ncbi:ubiquinol-cytochrome c reductase iron-sulfur subunit [Massilia sp. CCM 8695]|uniref:Ubiquinol-cytochrome c reductase iron-sulfur subunit n=2 Tax=Massilia frigida TaxID=2609281 RepID=A0ABX0N373_9BURK|nr:ubiquinol-cytochrome c reductase iron-sulfur subunit [Massilia frigida]
MLNTLVVTTEVVPLPRLRAEEQIKAAQALAEKANRSKDENDKLAQSIAAARDQLNIAELLGYGDKKDYKPMYQQIDDIEKKTAGGKWGKGWFEKIRQQLAEWRTCVGGYRRGASALRRSNLAATTGIPMPGYAKLNRDRRQWLLAATGVSGGAVLAAAAIPFVESLAPGEAAKAAGAPVEVDISQIAPGALLTIEWRGRPVWILHRTERMLTLLRCNDARLADPRSEQAQQPAYAANPTRSIRPAFLVATGICTRLGCVPVYRPEVAPADLGGDWSGGFYCPCHGSRFDLAGRVFKNVPAPSNLEIPPHEYLGDTRLRIGADREHPA